MMEMDEARQKFIAEASEYAHRLSGLSTEEVQEEFGRVFPEVKCPEEKSARIALIRHKLRPSAQPDYFDPPYHSDGRSTGIGDVFASIVKWYIWAFAAMAVIAPIIFYVGQALGFFPGSPRLFP